jgi:CheY-like chemotaxis protein
MGRSIEWSARTRAQEERFPLRGSACIAEPDEAERRRMAQVLRRMGFNVHETGSGAAASFIAAQTRLDVMVLNVMVRDARALTLIRQLRRAHPHLRLVALAPMDGPPVVLELARFAGADAVLQAPAFPPALARALVSPRRSVGEVTSVTSLEFSAD